VHVRDWQSIVLIGPDPFTILERLGERSRISKGDGADNIGGMLMMVHDVSLDLQRFKRLNEFLKLIEVFQKAV